MIKGAIFDVDGVLLDSMSAMGKSGADVSETPGNFCRSRSWGDFVSDEPGGGSKVSD